MVGQEQRIAALPLISQPIPCGLYAGKGLGLDEGSDLTASGIPSSSPFLLSQFSPNLQFRVKTMAEGLGDGRNEISIKKTASKGSTANLTPYFSEIWMPDL